MIFLSNMSMNFALIVGELAYNAHDTLVSFEVKMWTI